jgi:inosine/xanthosine triphosphate pyrophosphatase family protein
MIPGWDPIFEFEGKTYAEMDKSDKVCGVPFRPLVVLAREQLATQKCRAQ